MTEDQPRSGIWTRSAVCVQTLVISTAWNKINGWCGFGIRFGEQKNVRVMFCTGRCQCPLSRTRRRSLLGVLQ